MPDFETLVNQLFPGSGEQPSLLQLEQIADRFALIPYENFTKIIRASEAPSPVELMRDPAAVLDDFFRFGTGGTCFSLTHCLKSILDSRGFTSGPRMADLGRQYNNHCALVVEHDSHEYLIDPGYLITSPLPIPETGNVLHMTRLYPVRLEREINGSALHLSTVEPDGEKYRYRLHPEPVTPDAFRQFWLDSFSWSMMNSLLVTRVNTDGRFYMHDRHMRWYHTTGRRSLKVASAFDRTVARETGIAENIVRRARLLIARNKHRLLEKEGDIHG